MKSFGKRVCSLVLSLAMVLSMLYFAPLSASAESGTIYLNTPVDVTVTEDDPVNYLYFVPEESDIYYFYSMGSADTCGYIFDAEGTLLAENDDGDYDYNFLVSYPLTAGETYILASCEYGENAASYTVVVEGSGFEKIDLDTPVDVTVTDDAPWNYLLFSPEETGMYQFYSTGSEDTWGGIFDAHNEWLADDDDDGVGGNFTMNCLMTAGETYILASCEYDECAASYTVAVRKVETSEIQLNTPVNVTVTDDAPHNYLSFTPTETGMYHFYSTGGEDVYGLIFGTDGEVLAQDDDGGEGYNFKVSYPLTAGETYILDSCEIDAGAASYTVAVKKSDISSVTMKDVEVIEYVDAYFADFYNEDTDEWLEWECYDYRVDGVITYEDGSTSDFYNVEYETEIYDGQSYDSPWTVGNTYTVTVVAAGVEGTFSVSVVQNPVKKIEMADIAIIEGTNQESVIVNEDEEDEYEYEYYYYEGHLICTVTFQDNTTQTFEYGEIEMNDRWYYLHTWDDQDEENIWGVGKHTAHAELLGVTTEFTVEIIESPVVSAVFDDISLTENIDGWDYYDYNPETDEYDQSYFHYNYTPSCTVTLSDGTTLKSEDCYVTYRGVDYWIEFEDPQGGETPWNVGTHSVDASVLGVDGSFDVIINECPYESLSISGTNELVLTFTKKNGETETMTATGFACDGAGFGVRGGVLYTTGGTFNAVFGYVESEWDGPDYSKDVTLTIGTFESNCLDSNNWFEMAMLADNRQAYVLGFADGYAEAFIDEPFWSFDGVVSNDNIDHIVTLAANLSDDINDEETHMSGGYDYAVMDIDTVRDNIEQVFGITEIDLTKASGYNASNPSVINVFRISWDWYDYTDNLRFENGQWLVEYALDPEDYNYNSLKMAMNDAGQIQKIELTAKTVAPELTSVEIATEATKKIYEIGEALNTAGLSLKLSYSDGSSQTITSGFSVSGFDSAKAGSKTVTITYKGFTTSYVVSVVEKEILETDPQIVVSSGTANRGKQVKVSISLKNNPGIASATLRVKYNTNAMTLVGVEDAGKLGTAVHSDQLTNPYVLNWVNDTITQNITYSGEIATLTFEVADNAAFGAYAINVYYDYGNYDIYNVDGTEVKFYSVDGAINVVDTIIGDVNSDGVVNNLDRMVLTRYLANWEEYPESCIDKVAADVNSDGTVNNLDRMVLTRHLANWQGYEELPYAG